VIKVTVLHPNADVVYNREHHVPLTKALPGLRKYTVLEVMPDPLTGAKPSYNMVTEIWFDDADAYRRAFTSPEVETAIADVVNFSDFSKTVTLISEELEIPL
jgi:uncharacterized protein (TIGR02118 family)